MQKYLNKEGYMMYKVIDIEKWNRRSQYEWFSKFSNPCYSMNVDIDVTKVVEFTKETNTSFFINFLYVIMKSLNSVEEMRLRIVDNEVRLYDNIDPTYTILLKDFNFENAGNKMFDNYKDFYEDANNEISSIKNQNGKNIEYNSENNYAVYYITCVPWVNYTAMTHPVPNNMPESSSVPRICFSKYSLKDGKYILSFNINVSHALVDGYPLSKAFNKLIENSLNPELILKK